METIRNPQQVNRAIEQMVEFLERLLRTESSAILVGIANGGVPLVRRLATLLEVRLQRKVPTGILNVSFHRDDIGSRPIAAPKFPTSLPAKVQDAVVVLVDDVFHSGRTIRAAMDELFEHGRPKAVRLVVLVDRGSRILPIEPDFAALHLPAEPGWQLKVVIDPDDEHQSHIWAKPAPQTR
jgi:pyrimidine operon attenuation protein/uracil phosphoribosyltransferase